MISAPPQYIDFYKRWRLHAACAGAFFLPLKLTIAYIFFGLLILGWLFTSWPITAARLTKFYLPLLAFIAVAGISSLFGINPLASAEDLGSLLFFSLTIPVISTILRHPLGYLIFIALLAGQSLASFHSVLDATFPELFKLKLPGKVTESGQLALTLVVAGGFFLMLTLKEYRTPWRLLSPARESPRSEILLGIFNALILVATPYLVHLLHETPLQLALCAIPYGGLIAALLFARSWQSTSYARALRIFITAFVIPLLLAACMVNLKRGPWLGIAVGASLLLFIYQRRWIVPLLATGLALVLLITPARERLANSSRDFFIHGGRNVIWSIGSELIPRYPLGIGYSNSSFLQKFSTQIPPELKHFHNNVLNLFVETGILGLCTFYLWILTILRAAFSKAYRKSTTIFPVTLGCAIISWQTAGIVEYNVGDSEVFIIALVCVAGIVFARTVPVVAYSKEQR
jgi:hypothetical protein